MDLGSLIRKAEEDLQVFEPEPGTLSHFTDFDSFEDRLRDAEEDYQEMSDAFRATDAGSRDLMDAAARVEKAAQALVSRALTLYFFIPNKPEYKTRALEILDRVAKEASIRERTCSQYYRFMKEANPSAKDLIARIFDEKEKRMDFLNRCVRTHCKYIDKTLKEPDSIDPLRKVQIKAAARAERERSFVPEGSVFCPPCPFSPERIPEGMDVPEVPEPFLRAEEVDPSEKDFDVEHQTFVLRKDYLSEDGLIDGESVVYDWENHLVTMKYRGGIPVTWPFRQFVDPKEVPKPGEWFSDYYIRLTEQAYRDLEPGALQHRKEDRRDIPEYNRIPKK